MNDVSAITRQSDAFKNTAFGWNNYHSWYMISINAHQCVYIEAWIKISALSGSLYEYVENLKTYLRWDYSIVTKPLCNVIFCYWNWMIANKHRACTNSLLFSSTLTKRKKGKKWGFFFLSHFSMLLQSSKYSSKHV